MFEIGTEKGWNSLAFSGNADFKREVMKAALEKASAF